MRRTKKDVAKDIVLPRPCTARSRFFPLPPLDVDALLRNPGFIAFYDDFVAVLTELYYAKPILIQGMLHVPAK